MTKIENLRPGQTVKLNNGMTKRLSEWHTFRALGGEWTASLRFDDGDEINVPADTDLEVL